MICSRYTGLNIEIVLLILILWEHLYVTVLKEALLEVFGKQRIQEKRNIGYLR